MISWIPEGHCAIMERFGQFTNVQEAGLYFYIPFVDDVKRLYSWQGVATKSGYLIEKSEQQINTPTRYCQTKDNVTIRANTSLAWRIIDPKKAVYETDHLPTMISDLALNSLRSSVGQLDLHDVFSSRAKINQQINADLEDIVNKWGVQLLRVEIQELSYTEETNKVIMKEMIAERERRAKIAIAQGDAESTLLLAQARASARELDAQAEAKALIIEAEAAAKARQMQAESESEYLEKLKEKVGEDATKLLLADKQKSALESITDNPAHKVFLTPEMNNLMMTQV